MPGYNKTNNNGKNTSASTNCNGKNINGDGWNIDRTSWYINNNSWNAPTDCKNNGNSWNISASGNNNNNVNGKNSSNKFNGNKFNGRRAFQPPRSRPARAPPSQLAAGAWGAAVSLIHAEDKALYEENLEKREREVFVPPSFATTFKDKSGVKHFDDESVAKNTDVATSIVVKDTEAADNIVVEAITDDAVNKNAVIADSKDEIKDYEKRSADILASLKANLKKAGWKLTGSELKLERLQGYRVAHH